MRGDAALRDLTWDPEFPIVMINAYGYEQLGKLHRIAYNFFGFREELLCDGDRLIAGTSFDSYFVRPNHEADLATLQQAPRIKQRAFPDELEAKRPWLAKETWFTDNLVVTRDIKQHTVELRSFERRTGKLVSTRDFADQHGVICEAHDHDELACTLDQDNHLRLEARSLADREDHHDKPAPPSPPPCQPAPPTDLPPAAFQMCGAYGWFVLSPTADHHGLIALVGKNGKVRWQTPLAGEPTASFKAGNQILVATSSAAQRVVALDLPRGQIHWTVVGP